jgi:hypothetical protein
MASVTDVYPIWKFYPSAIEPPRWVSPVVAAFAAIRSQIDSRLNVGVTSDAALAVLRPELVHQGFEIEDGKTKAGTIRRPVLFGEVGKPVVAYEVDGFHPEHQRGLPRSNSRKPDGRCALPLSRDDASLRRWPIRGQEL